MPNVPLPKEPIPTGGGSGAVQLAKVVGQVIIQEILTRTIENAKKQRPPEAGENPPTPDPESDEFLCIQATWYNTLAIQDVAAAIDRHSAANAVGITELTKALNSIDRKLSAIVDSLNYSLPYVGWLKDTAELFYRQNQQNSDLLLQRLAQSTQEFTGRQVQTLNAEEIPFEPVNDLQVDVRIDGVDNEELDSYAEIADTEEPPAP